MDDAPRLTAAVVLPERAPTDLADHLRAGASLGLPVGILWAFAVFGPALEHSAAWLERVGPPVMVALILGSWIGGSAWFAWLLQRRIGARGRGGPIAAGGVALLVILATLQLAGSIEVFAVQEGGVAVGLLPYVFTAAFAPHASCLVFALVLTVGLRSRAARTWRSALLAAALTGAVFVVLSLVLNQLPGWRVGGGDRAMLKVALVANTLAAAVGGAAALTLLDRSLRASTRAGLRQRD